MSKEPSSMITVAYNANDMKKVEKAINYFDNIKTNYCWRELYDNWNFPFTYKFDFVNNDDMIICKLFLSGKRVNLTLTSKKT
jgi:hypothetical protein